MLLEIGSSEDLILPDLGMQRCELVELGKSKSITELLVELEMLVDIELILEEDTQSLVEALVLHVSDSLSKQVMACKVVIYCFGIVLAEIYCMLESERNPQNCNV